MLLLVFVGANHFFNGLKHAGNHNQQISHTYFPCGVCMSNNNCWMLTRGLRRRLFQEVEIFVLAVKHHYHSQLFSLTLYFLVQSCKNPKKKFDSLNNRHKLCWVHHLSLICLATDGPIDENAAPLILKPPARFRHSNDWLLCNLYLNFIYFPISIFLPSMAIYKLLCCICWMMNTFLWLIFIKLNRFAKLTNKWIFLGSTMAN